jgi:hypothetical protein
MDTNNQYDVIVVGAGPAGLTAGIYLSRARLKTLIVDEGTVGGQMVLTHEIANYPGVDIITEDYPETGKNLAKIYLDFLKEWKFDITKQQPLQTIKSFIIILTGCETDQRVNEKSVTFVMMDAGKVWEKNKIKEILTGALNHLKSILNVKHDLAIDFIDILGEREVGKYFCAKCGMFFEFGIKRETVTCPLMAQKCMFDPQHIDKIEYTSDKLVKQFGITPDIYKRFIESVNNKSDFSEKLNEILKEWKVTDKQDEIMKRLV